MDGIVLVGLGAIPFVALMLVLASVKIVPEYERGVVSGWAGWSARAAPAYSCSSRSSSAWCASIRV